MKRREYIKPPVAHARTVHLAGPLRYRRLAKTVDVPAGSPVCVLGALADVLRERGTLATDRTNVTCPRCREAIASEVI